MKPKQLAPAQIRAARALLHWSAEDLVLKSAVGLATIRRAENSQNENVNDSGERLGRSARTGSSGRRVH